MPSNQTTGFRIPAYGPPPSKVAAVDFSTGTGTGTLSITSSAIDWTPDAALFFLVGENSNAKGFCMGAMEGSALDWVLALHVLDGASTSETMRRGSALDANDVVLMLFDSSGVYGEAEFSQWVSGGVELNITNAFPNDSEGICVLFNQSLELDFGAHFPAASEDDSSELNTAGPMSVVIGVTSIDDIWSDSNLNEAAFSIGAWDKATQMSYDWWAQDNKGTAQTRAKLNSDVWVTEGLLHDAEFENSGYTETVLGGAHWDVTTRRTDRQADTRISHASIGKVNAKVSKFTSSTSTGLVEHNNAGFTPQAVILINTQLREADIDAEQNNDRCELLGVSVFTPDMQKAIGLTSDHNVGTSDVSIFSEAVAYRSEKEDGGYLIKATFSKMTGGGYELNYSDVQTPAKIGIEIAIG